MARISAVRPKLSQVTITDPQFAKRIADARNITLPDMLNKFDDNKYFDNFDTVAAGHSGDESEHHGMPWADGLCYELIRAASDFLAVQYDDALDARLDGYITRIAAAAAVDPDGYLATYTTHVVPQQRFGQHGGFLIVQHDLYNFGCLVEAGVHHYRATGKISLLKVAERYADYICSYMGLPPKKNIVPAHPLAEEAMQKLYRLAKEDTAVQALSADWKEYGRLAQYWLDNRGHHEGRANFPPYLREYAQDHRPLLEQREAVGHAVRAVLLYTGLTATAAETGRQDLFDTSKALWRNVTRTKMHISGGVGANANEESFGFQYELPNNAYLETCAGVGMAFWAGELALTDENSEYMDTFERAVCNNVFSGVSESGDRYFYVNPLQSNGSEERWEWHPCPCCPPMYLKLLAMLQTYAYALDGDTVYVQSLLNSRLNTDTVSLEQKNGVITLNAVHPVTLKIRIPAYLDNVQVTRGDMPVPMETANGYLVLHNCSQETITITATVSIIRNAAHPYADADRKKVAVTRGAFLYCAEGHDNDDKLDFTLSKDPMTYDEEHDRIIGTTIEGKKVTLIPYYFWNNRGKSVMGVWFPQEGHESDRMNTTGWEDRLYRPLYSDDPRPYFL